MVVKAVRKRVQWSKEPDEEPDFSDWKITLAIKKSDDTFTTPASSQIEGEEKISPSPSTVTFSVHRNILGLQSEYFKRIFKSNNNSDDNASVTSTFTESRHQHSLIDFPSTISVKTFGIIVEAFEALLNYCYLENVNFKGTSPVPLLYLCDYFQMEDDFENKVEDYSKIHFNDMASQTTLNLLYEQILEFRAVGLNVEQAQSILSENCYIRMDLLKNGSPLAIIADLPLWLDVVLIIQERGYKSNIQYSSNSCSTFIVNFFENNDNSSAVDSESFQKLTDEKVLPNVDVDAALVLLKEEQKYATPDVPISDDDNTKETEPLALTNLQNRCLESLIKAKLELTTQKELRDRATKVMILLPRVMGSYLNKTLNLYGEEQAKLVQEQAELVQELYEQKQLTRTNAQAYKEESYRLQQQTIRHDSQREKAEQEKQNTQQELKIEKGKYQRLAANVKTLGYHYNCWLE